MDCEQGQSNINCKENNAAGSRVKYVKKKKKKKHQKLDTQKDISYPEVRKRV